MRTKKIIVLTLGVGIIVSACTVFYVSSNNNNKDTINQNIVYTKSDSAKELTKPFDSIEDLLGQCRITGSEENYYKYEASENLKQYFNISDEDLQDMSFTLIRINQKTLDEVRKQFKDKIQESYDNNKITKAQYDKEIEKLDEDYAGSLKSSEKLVENLNHGIVQATWSCRERIYQCAFNENTKSIDNIGISEFKGGSNSKSSINENELESYAAKYIKDNNINYINNPKLILKKEKECSP